MEDLFLLFKALNKPDEADGVESFATTNISGVSHRIGKDKNGNPAILVKELENDKGTQIQLEHLHIQRSIRCRITNKEKVENGTFTIIRCTHSNEELCAYFLRSVEPVLRSLGPTPKSHEISRAIEHLVELFRALTQPPIKSVAGLWAELVVIQNSKNPISLLKAWHSSPEDKYDFNAGLQRIEVKSTSRRERTHHFSLEQLMPPTEAKAVVASVFTERSGGGLSLGELANNLRGLCSSDLELVERFDRVIAQTLGSSLQRSLVECFDLELAIQSIQVFKTADIPRIQETLPPGISDVHFMADLGRSPSLSKQDLLEYGGLFSLIFK